MSIIKIMDVNLSNKIAAGEVVEKLMNVVKELVENSIDARSSEINIDLIESGLTEIKVTDDGTGMSKEDVINSLKRHATSKIYDDSDLFKIDTLGFRGEALPSIASVSKMEISSSMGDIGTRIVIHGGEEQEISSSDARRGTTVTVKNIFYNTPARLKYLKSTYTELANIIDYVNKMALSFPNIKFTLTNDEKMLLNTDGSNNLLKVINSIYGLSVSSKMVKIENVSDDYEISGYISFPEVNRSTKNSLTILVNNRVIKNSEINKTILESYHTYLFKDRYPVVVLNILVDPSLIDVNIHPTKMDIKFSKMDYLKDLIFKTVSRALQNLTLIPKYEQVSELKQENIANNKVDFTNEITEKVNIEEIKLNFAEPEIFVSEKQEEIKKEKFVMIEPIGVIHGTYIIGENEIGMFIIDQHAAQERINYEYYLKEMGKDTYDTIDLLIPIKIEFTAPEYLKFKENMQALQKLNISIEEFGENTIIVRNHPIFIKKDYAEESIRKIIDVVINMGSFDKEKFIEKSAITLACKMSIKANEQISLEEMRQLIRSLRETNNPFTCPHGRPTIISFTKYELEKMFKRAE
ncbi:MAG TPA: DNA mismatch repair endonuclease MutL [Bacilli bacterium]|nr:DNA mismatch repair endonuclease MutL [Bacilli bacterium]